MYLGTLHVTLDLEPEVLSADRERIFRRIRDRMRQLYGQRITVRTDDAETIAIAFLDSSYGRARERLEEMTERLESFSEARIAVSTPQVFQWFDGEFRSTAEVNELGEGELPLSGEQPRSRPGLKSGQQRQRDVFRRYPQEDDEGGGGFPPIPTRFGRRPNKVPGRR